MLYYRKGLILKRMVFNMRINTNLLQTYPLETLVSLVKSEQLIEVYVGGELKETQALSPYASLFERRSHFFGRLKEDGIMPIRYAPLHVHSYYSLLDALMSPKKIASYTELMCALTDHGSLAGFFEFYQEMKKQGKVPIIGLEAYCETIDGERKRNHLVLLAETEEGLKNIIKLRTLAEDNFYYRPHLKWEWLKQHAKGVICLTACVSGEIPKALREDDYPRALKVLQSLIEVFGRQNVFLEIQRHGIEPEQKANPGIERLSKETGIRIVATPDAHYAEKKDSYLHGIVKKMDNKVGMDGENYHMLTSDEMEMLYWDHPEYLDTSLEIAERCQIQIKTAKENGYILPDFPLPAPFQSQDEYFKHTCWEGFKQRYEQTPYANDPERIERLTFEIETICNMGFSGYFNIVADFVNYAKTNDILVGPGRGSVCGSIVAYVLGITEVDPVEHHLLFERFLNPDRITMPDIDLDFQDDRREEVITYVKNLYGVRSVSRIITYGRYQAKGAVRAMQRVFDYPLALAEKICKLIPSVPNITLDVAMHGNKDIAGNLDLVKLYEQDERVKQIIDLAKEIEGMPSHKSMHACGVVITKGEISDYIPQCQGVNPVTKLPESMTEVNMIECEALGLLKMDFLGLRALSVLGETIQEAKRQNLMSEKITFDQIPTTDLGIYQDLSQGKTAGVFQLESPGMINVIKQLYQDHKKNDPQFGAELFARLVAGIALYRPGPMKEIPNFITNLLHPEQIHYPIEETRSFLEQTYAIIVYQEQVMSMVRMLAGFSMGQADTVRKAMSKKTEELLNEYGHYFVYGSTELNIKGCLANGIDESLAMDLWDKMKEFGKYGFNRSHATGYAIIAARSAYLSHYFPTFYMASTFNSYLSNTDRIQLYMGKSQEAGIKVLPPHINYSQAKFSADVKSVRFGLKGLKHMGSYADEIIDVREKHGAFKSFTHFILSMAQHSHVKKQPIESLIYSGALDCFKGTRQFKIQQLEYFINLSKPTNDLKRKGLMSFHYLLLNHSIQNESTTELEWFPMDEAIEVEFDRRHLIEKEFEYAGFYITQHPLDPYFPHLFHEQLAKASELKVDYNQEGTLEEASDSLPEESNESVIESLQSSTYQSGDTVYLAGVFKDIETKFSKKTKRPYAFGSLRDKTGSMRLSFFGPVYLKHKDLLSDNRVVMIKGRYEVNDFGAQVNVESVTDLEEAYGNQTLTAIEFVSHEVLDYARQEYKYLFSISQAFTGQTPIRFYNSANQQYYELPNGIEFNSIVSDRFKQAFQPHQFRLIFNYS